MKGEEEGLVGEEQEIVGREDDKPGSAETAETEGSCILTKT